MTFICRFAVLGLVLPLGLPLSAQDAPVFNGKVYAPVPSYAYARVPKGGLSRFYGSARLGAPRDEEVRVHFYYWLASVAPPVDKNEKNSEAHRNYRVDIFVRKLQKKARFHLVQSVDIPKEIFNGIEPAMETVGYNVQWLTPKKRVTPMIRLLAAQGVPFELHVYENGPHGVGLADGNMGAPDLPNVADWSARLESWLKRF